MESRVREKLFFAGWLIDGTGVPASRHALLRVRDGRFSALDNVQKSELSDAGLAYVDLSQCTILPGLVDCHAHLTMSGKTDRMLREEQLGYSFEQNAPLISNRLAKYLSCGILAVRDAGDPGAQTLGHMKRDSCGSSGYPVLRCAGRGWRAPGRYGKLVGDPPEPGSTLAEGIRRQSAEAHHIKIINSGLNSLTEFGKETPPQFEPGELQAAVNLAKTRGQKIMVHANGKLPVRLSVGAGCDSIEHGFFMGEENLQIMADRQVFWVPTAFTMKALRSHLQPGSMEAEIAFRNLEHQLAQMSRARELGVPVALGTDAGGFGVRHGISLVEELQLIMRAGFTVEEAIRCATLNGARLLGVDDILGRLRPGMPANFLVVEGPPSMIAESLRRVKAVYIDGNRMV